MLIVTLYFLPTFAGRRLGGANAKPMTKIETMKVPRKAEEEWKSIINLGIASTSMVGGKGLLRIC